MWFSFAFFDAMTALTIMTVNVRGLRNALKRRAVFDFLGKNKFDICLLQEAHLKDGGI